MSNFRVLLDVISSLKPSGRRLLDVGCAHDWFLEAAASRFEVLGVEPDENVFKSTLAKGLPVLNGYFPEVLDNVDTFDVIVFNDVIEHIPDICQALQSCRDRLNDNGLLVLNLPSSAGLFYRISKMLGRIGKSGFFDRMWQKDLPSPHVHYFNSKNLSDLLKGNNFTSIRAGALPTLSLAGLYTRISYTGNLGVASKVFVYCAVAAALPFLRIFPSDIIYVIARKS